MTRLSVFAAAFLAAIPVYAQECQAPNDVKAALDAATSPTPKSSDERIAAARRIRDQFPSQYFAHRFYQDMFISQGGLYTKAIQEEYRALLDRHPDDRLYMMLYARTLKGTNTPEAIRLLNKVVERNPDSAPARLKLVEIYSAPAFRDEQKLVANADAYWKTCPESLSGYLYVIRIEDAQFIARTAARLRKLLEGRTDTEALGLYVTLWALEFKAVPLSEQEPVRARVRKDADLLRSQDMSKHGFLVHELVQAYKMLGDAEGTKWADAEVAKRGGGSMPSSSAAMTAIQEWRKANPYKSGFERDTYQEKLVKQTEDWIHQWPDDPQPRYERFQALRMMRDAPLEDTVSAAEDWIRIYDRHPLFISPYLHVAQFYAQHNMRYTEIPDLLEKELKRLPATPPSPAPVSDLYPATSQSARSQANALSTVYSVASIFIKLKKYDGARELLKDKPPELETESETKQSATVYSYWHNMAELARVDGNKTDVLAFERKALLANPFSNRSGEDYQVRALRDLWKEVKGSEDGFDAWLGKPTSNTALNASPAAVMPLPGGWTKLEKPLPDFRISDADGKMWRLDDLKGKVALVNLWATWCGPCREELPYLQKLFNKVRERKDLVVVTLNTDDNPGMIGPFLKETKYTFPVLPASAYVSKLIPELSIPRNWIVDSKGVLRLENIGFNPGNEKWVDEMVAEMEKMR